MEKSKDNQSYDDWVIVKPYRAHGPQAKKAREEFGKHKKRERQDHIKPLKIIEKLQDTYECSCSKI